MSGTDKDMCFVCGGALASIVNGESNWRSRKTGAALLENNLHVIFLLRELVQVPIVQLEAQLKKSADNPESWIRLCDQCIWFIKKARELEEGRALKLHPICTDIFSENIKMTQSPKN